MPKALKDLLDERMKLVAENRKVLSAAQDGKLSADQTAEYEARDADIETLSEEIEGRKKVDSLKASAARYDEYESAPPARQTPREVPAKVAERLRVKVGRHEREVDAAHQLAVRDTPEYLAAFDAYLLAGATAGLERLGVMVSKDDKGGYAAGMATTNRLIKFVDDMVFMRKIATVLPPIPEAVSLGAVSYDTDPGDADWTPEVPASSISEDDSMAFGKRELMPHLDTKLVKASEKFLRSAQNLPGGAADFITGRLGYKFGITEEKAFLTGDGVQQPLGVFVADDNGVPTSRDYTCSSGTGFTGDDLINSFYTLKPQYQDRATGLFSRTFVKKARTLKDGNGQYLWQPGLTAGQPDRVLNRPYVQSEHVPSTFTTGLYVGMWADFSWYWIVDSLGFTITRLGELFQLTNQIGFLGRKETDGQPVLAEAFVRLKLG